MRVIVFALVALNIVIAVVFEVWKDPSSTTKQPPVNVGQLRLAHELTAAVPAPLQANPEKFISSAPAVDSADAPLNSVLTEAPVVQAEVEKIQPVVEAKAAQVEVTVELSNLEALVEQAVVETQPQAPITQLKVEPVVEPASQAPLDEPVAETVAIEPVCWVSETKPNKEAFESITLPESVSLLSTASTKVSSINGYKVIVPAQESREAAIKVVEQLAEGGITDVWRFRKGTMINAISLGIFSKQETASEIAAKASALGISADVLPRNRTKTTWTAIFKGNPDSQAALEGLVGKVSQVVCE
jgi:hypothetical protein